MINSNPSSRLVKHIIRSYARLAENTRVRSILRDNLPQILKEKHFFLSLDESSKKWLSSLSKSLANITSNSDRMHVNGLNTNIPGLNQMGGVNTINNMSNMNNFNTGVNINGMSNMNNYMINQNDLIGNGYNYNGYEYGDGMKSSNFAGVNNNVNPINNVQGKSYLNLNAGSFNFKNAK
jgi:hypothetical protein